jgi:hypothetical protein
LATLSLCTGCGGGSTSGGGGTGGTGGGGGTSQPTTIQVQFTQSSASNSSVVVPTAVATQVGTGSWTAATLSNGTLTISIPAGTQNYAFAFVCPAVKYATYQNNTSYTIPYSQEYIEELTVQDSAGPIDQFYCTSTNTSNPPSTTAVTLNVDASAIQNATQVGILSSLGSGFLQQNTGTVSMNLTSGTSDFLVYALDQQENILAMQRLHSQTIPGSLNGGNPVVLTASDETTVEPVTFQNAPANSNTNVFSLFLTSSGLGLTVWDENTNYQLIDAYRGMPADVVESGDFYSISGTASTAINSSTAEVSEQTSSITTPTTGPVSLTLPPPLPTSDANNINFTANTMPTFNITYGGFSNSSLTYLSDGGRITWTQESSTNTPQAEFVISVTASAAYLNSATTLSIPDVSAIPGFIAAPGSGHR